MSIERELSGRVFAKKNTGQVTFDTATPLLAKIFETSIQFSLNLNSNLSLIEEFVFTGINDRVAKAEKSINDTLYQYNLFPYSGIDPDIIIGTANIVWQDYFRHMNYDGDFGLWDYKQAVKAEGLVPFSGQLVLQKLIRVDASGSSAAQFGYVDFMFLTIENGQCVLNIKRSGSYWQSASALQSQVGSSYYTTIFSNNSNALKCTLDFNLKFYKKHRKLI